jgi:hypothetical protein
MGPDHPLNVALRALTVLFVWLMRAASCMLRLLAPQYRRRMDSWVQMALEDPGEYAVFIFDAEYDCRRRLRNPLMAASCRAQFAFVLRSVGGRRHFQAAHSQMKIETASRRAALRPIDPIDRQHIRRSRERRPRCVAGSRRRRVAASGGDSGDDGPAEPAPALALALSDFSRFGACGGVLLLASGVEVCANRRCSRYGEAS